MLVNVFMVETVVIGGESTSIDSMMLVFCDYKYFFSAQVGYSIHSSTHHVSLYLPSYLQSYEGLWQAAFSKSDCPTWSSDNMTSTLLLWSIRESISPVLKYTRNSLLPWLIKYNGNNMTWLPRVDHKTAIHACLLLENLVLEPRSMKENQTRSPLKTHGEFMC